MAWVRLDDNFTDHPKIARLTPSAGWLWVCGLAYCNRHQTDGRIPVAMLSRLCSLSNASRSAKRLIDVGLWYRDGSDFVVHDYLDYQPSASKVTENSEKKAKAGRAGGLAKAKQRASVLGYPDPTRPDPTRIVVCSGDETVSVNDLHALTHEWPGWSRPMGLTEKAKAYARELDWKATGEEIDEARTEAENAGGTPNIGLLLSIIARRRRNGSPTGRPERRKQTPEEASAIALAQMEKDQDAEL